jgi:hypothetical protein
MACIFTEEKDKSMELPLQITAHDFSLSAVTEADIRDRITTGSRVAVS